MRFALYYTPSPSHPLAQVAQSWLGRDAFTGLPMPMEDLPEFAQSELSHYTAEPRRYGFHATLVAPFRLAPDVSVETLEDAANAFASQQAAFTLPRLKITRIGNFIALTPAKPSLAIDRLASAAVDHFNPLRAPLSEEDIARRNPHALTTRQLGYLERYGYPYVKAEFRFHMTLTGPVLGPVADDLEQALHQRFGPVLETPLRMDAVSLFVEPEPAAPFIVHSSHAFDDTQIRKTA
jgi:putative phosphonate metabolism protein